jgi:lipopolysaccharide transport system permease protein
MNFATMPTAILPASPSAEIVRTTTSRPGKLVGPVEFITGIIQHRHLIGQLTRREVLGRYRGSRLGLLWPFLNPVLLLIIYTIVFRFIFKAKFNGRFGENDSDFALMLFSGLIVFNVFAECIARAPSLILQNANYVNRVVFPLEILPITIVLSSLFHLLMSFVPLVLVTFVLKGHLNGSVAEWPLLLLPLFAYALGTAWLLAALGVFLRDLNEVVLAATTILMYASAVFYPISVVSDKVPALFQPLVQLNPIAHLIEQSRQISVAGRTLDLADYGWQMLGGSLCMLLGYVVFMRVKHAFADVI